MSICTTNGIHRLPAAEDSWGDATADLVVAAGLDSCHACDHRLSVLISRDPANESYGKLFTTFVLGALERLVMIGYYTDGMPMPTTGLDLFPGASVQALDPQTRRVLGELRFPPLTGQTALGVVAIRMPGGEGAARVLRSMSRQDRLAVLGDILDHIVGGIAAKQLFSMPPS